MRTRVLDYTASVITKRSAILLVISSLALFGCSLGGGGGSDEEGGGSRPVLSDSRGAAGFASAPSGFRPAGTIPARPDPMAGDRPDQTSTRPNGGTPADRPHEAGGRPDDGAGSARPGDDDAPDRPDDEPPRGDDGSGGDADDPRD